SNTQFTEDQLAKLKRAFDLIDKDGDGSITAQELSTVLKPFGQNPAVKEAPKVISELDLNGNGKIEFNEFITLMQGDGLGDCSFELGDIFRITDKDGNSYINKEELRQAMANIGEHLNARELDAIIKGAGENKV
ncbi:calmodulin-like 3, partial [Coemansia sp. RSA 1836]